MKIPALLQAALLVPCLGILTLAPAAETEPPTAPPRVLRAPSARPAPASAQAGTELLRATPLQDYWNATSWDSLGGSLFWHDLSEKRRQAMSERHSKRTASGVAAPR